MCGVKQADGQRQKIARRRLKAKSRTGGCAALLWFWNFTAFEHESIMHKAPGLKSAAVQMQQSRPEHKFGRLCVHTEVLI